MDSLTTEELSCPVCHEIFKAPVLLSCSHNVCKKCLRQFWRTKESQECPVCGKTSSKDPSCNIALKNLHRGAQIYTNQTCRLICEDVPSNKGGLNTALQSLQEKLKHGENLKREFEKTFQLIKSQAEYTEHQIKEQFKKLHQFLRDEEEATITALREEEEQKKQKMKEKLKEMNRHISLLSHSIKDLEEMKKAKDVHLLEKFPVMMERVQISLPDPQMPYGALIHVSRYLGNLPYRVWKKMLNSVQKTPVILDPNTVHPRLVLSHDLTRVKFVWDEQPFPDNPERFDICECVLSSEGFNSGTHSWEVEVKESECWSLGVTTESNQRKGRDCCETDVWCVKYDPYSQLGSGFPVKQELEYVRVYLDYDGGTVSFSDPVTNTHLHTFTTTFTDIIFPIFCNLDELKCLRILPVKL